MADQRSGFRSDVGQPEPPPAEDLGSSALFSRMMGAPQEEAVAVTSDAGPTTLPYDDTDPHRTPPSSPIPAETETDLGGVATTIAPVEPPAEEEPDELELALASTQAALPALDDALLEAVTAAQALLSSSRVAAAPPSERRVATAVGAAPARPPAKDSAVPSAPPLTSRATAPLVPAAAPPALATRPQSGSGDKASGRAAGGKEEGPAVHPSGSRPARLSEPSGWKEGQLVAGRYRLCQTLGQGGIGEVFLADDLFLRCKVALKTLRPVFANDPDGLAAFRQEVALAHTVNHPGLARTYDMGLANGVPYLSMEYLAGESLADRLQQGPLAIAEVRRLGLAVAAALDAAHQAGVIHRDLKPANILLTPDRGPVVLDFGLAAANPQRNRRAAGPTSDLIRPTTSAEGTPMYMAPEQWRGEPQGMTTDIYALGCILYECLTGQLPFQAETRAAMMKAHLEQPVPSVRSRRPDTPLPLEQLIAACLEKEPRRRPQSMLAVGAQLVPRSWLPFGLTVLLSLAVLGLVTSGGLILWETASTLLLREMRPAVARLAENVSHQLAADDLDQIRGSRHIGTEPFKRVWRVLRRIKQKNPEVRYIYTLRLKAPPATWEFVVDADHEDRDKNGNGTIEPDERGSKPGDIFDARPYPAIQRTHELKQPQSDEQFGTDAWGLSLSGYAPLTIRRGQDFYLVGIDVGNEPIESLRNVLYAVFLTLGILSAALVVVLRWRRAGVLPGFTREAGS